LKAFVYKKSSDGSGFLKEADIPKPQIKDSGAIIKVLGCGLCGSDIVKYKHGTEENTVFGHEVVGIIEKIKTETNFKVGDRVVLGHHVPCYDCVYCKNGNFSMCKEFKSTNIVPGGFSEYIFVSEKHLKDTVNIVPEFLSDEKASFTEPAACCLRAVRRAKINKGDKVLVIGLGSIGLLMGQILKHFGARVLGCDLMENRMQTAKNLGFDEVFSPSFSPENMMADKVFLVSGSEKTIPLALNSVRDGGVICLFASVASDTAGFANNEVYYRDLTVFGSYSPASTDLADSLDLISKNIIKTENLSTQYEFSELNQAIEDTIANKILKAYIKIS